MIFTTTLRLITRYEPCRRRLAVLRRALPTPDDLEAEIPVSFILMHNGLTDAVWAMQAVPEAQREASRRCLVRFCADLAQRALELHLGNVPVKVDVNEAIRLMRMRQVMATIAEDEVVQMSRQLHADTAQVRLAGLPWNIIFATAAVACAFKAVSFCQPWEATLEAHRELEAAAVAAEMAGGEVGEYRAHEKMFRTAMEEEQDGQTRG